MQSLGTSQWNATRKPNPNTLGFNPQDQVILVSTVLNKVLELVLLTNTSSFKNNNDVNSSKQLVTGILWDRMDSLANTIAIYIALEKQQFQYISEVFINRQSDPDVKNTLIRNFQQLVSHGNYDMENINRNNRQIFVRNFREFMTQIKSLSLK